MTSHPSVVVFDLGKVLLDFDYGIAAAALAPLSSASAAAIRNTLDQSPLLFDLESGRISRTEFATQAGREIGFRGSASQFANAFADIFSEIPAMIQLHARVHGAGFPTYILSNTNDIAVEHIRRRFPFFAGFNGYILSHEIRCMKPDAPIYAALEHIAGCREARILYLDDRLENVAAARARGWLALHHTSVETSVAAVHATLGL